MFDKVQITSPKELLAHKLGAALTMEHAIVEMLGTLREKANEAELQELFTHHRGETQQQIRNLEQAFSALGHEPEPKPCPAIEGLEKEGQANIKMTADHLVDAVILAGAAETEHHEIAVYEGLITHAEAHGHEDVAALLRENLEQEQHTLDEVRNATERVAQTSATTA